MSTPTELDPRNQEAIQSALSGDWEKAVQINSDLFEDYPEDLSILNRLGHAYTELGQVNKANSTYKKVLEIDPYNPIAMRNLDRLSTLRGANITKKDTNGKTIDPDLFIEEPGKTKTIPVNDLAMPKVLITLRAGDGITLNVTKDGVSVISEDNSRLGKLDPTWGSEVSQAMNLGSKFTGVIKSVKVGRDQENSSLSVFLRETERSKKLAHPPFPVESSNFTPFVKEETLSYLKEQETIPTESSEGVEEVEVDSIPSDIQEHLPEEESMAGMVEDEEDFSPK